MAEPAVIAIDVGGTSIKGAVIPEQGGLHFQQTVPTPETNALDAIARLVATLQRAATNHEWSVEGAGIVTPGMVDENAGHVAYASNLGWRDLPLAENLRDRIALPTFVGHDVRAAGLAERLLGTAQASQDFFFIPIGTGVAAAIISAGQAIRGARSAAGEIGHIPIVPDGEKCMCGQRGCLEVYVSGAGIARRYRAQGGENLTARQITQQLPTDPLARKIWDEGMRALAQGLTIVTLLIDPAHIVIGGGFADAGATMLKPVQTYLADNLAWREPPLVTLSSIGRQAGVIGAGIAAFHGLGHANITDQWIIAS
jgi:glucokinase